MAAARLARVPVGIASKRETGGMRTLSQKKLEKQVFRLSRALVANSEAVKNYLVREGVPARKINVIYNGLDLKRLAPETRDRREICERLGLPTCSEEKIKFITLVANLRHEVKNHPMFLRAARIVAERHPEAHFVLAGEGELRVNLEKFAAELGIGSKTHFIGRCDRVAELLHVSFAGVLCSFAEGFSNSILEYMAASKPVVATDVGGAREAVREGVTGFLVASNDHAALAEKLVDLLRDEARARDFGAAGRLVAEEKFSLAAQLEKTLELYERESNDR
jgi:glycosyltransferase involved in cell wall biosynthesis